MAEQQETLPRLAQEAVLMETASMAIPTPVVRGYDWNRGVDWEAALAAYSTTGFQATSLGNAIGQVNAMLNWSLNDEPVAEDEDPEFRDPAVRQRVRCKVFLAYTSNLISAGTRETLRFLAQHSMVQVITTTAGGIEEDFIKCLAPTYLGDFALKGNRLRKQGINRTGNLLVPNENYCKFEDWFMPILDAMLEEQRRDGVNWTPSKMIHRMGREINNEESVYYWCYRNNIPVFCPAITDGSIGDMLYFHSYKNPGLIVDIAADIRAINDQAVRARKTGMLILGGGLVKHHTCNANLMRNGADFSVYINTAQEFDGSDSGARPDEAVSWGKIRIDSQPVKVYSEVTLVLPLLVGTSFARRLHSGLPVGNSDGKAIFNKSYTETEHQHERTKLARVDASGLETELARLHQKQ
eukprot:TRINITY_DN8910_c0_g1_i1.p1 TRINITY_DN8910_c0_g1~~TRINITY_DN8910_c0_g1_i1.p1  ORF type:complete len:410 (-),score=78.23 TRINITY_DN8910_c0_g1_i1:37-1266(-)